MVPTELRAVIRNLKEKQQMLASVPRSNTAHRERGEV